MFEDTLDHAEAATTLLDLDCDACRRELAERKRRAGEWIKAEFPRRYVEFSDRPNATSMTVRVKRPQPEDWRHLAELTLVNLAPSKGFGFGTRFDVELGLYMAFALVMFVDHGSHAEGG